MGWREKKEGGKEEEEEKKKKDGGGRRARARRKRGKGASTNRANRARTRKSSGFWAGPGETQEGAVEPPIVSCPAVNGPSPAS